MAKKKDHEPLQRWTPPAETFSNSNIQQSSNTSNVKYERDEAKASRSGGNSLFNAAKRFLSANDDAAEMTYGVYNPSVKDRSRAGNVLGASGKAYQAGQLNMLAFLLGQDQNKVDKTRSDAKKFMIEHGYAKPEDFGESQTDKWLAEKSGKLTEKAKKLNEEAAEHETEAKKGLGKVGQDLVDAGIAGGQMLMDAGIGGLTGTGMLSMGTRVFGQSTREALDNGATRGQAAAYGLGSAAVEVGTEKMFDAVKLFGGGSTEKILEGAISKMAKSDAGRTALRAVGNMSGEALEELISGTINPVLRATTFDPDAMKDYKTREFWENNAHDALIGLILGATGVGGSIVTGQNAQANAELRANDQRAAEQLEAQRMEEFNQRQQRQRDYFAGNTMQTGTADADAAVVLNRNARGRGEAAMIAEVVKASNVDPETAFRNLQAYEAQQNAAQQAQAVEQVQQPTQPQNAAQAVQEPQTVQPVRQTAEQDLNTVRESIGRNPTWDDLISHFSQQGESGGQAYQRIADAFQRGALVDGGNSGIYTRAEIEQRQTSMPESDHIDNRTAEYNSKTSTKPFQLTHPELHPYFAEAAKALQQEAVNSFSSDMPNLKGGKIYSISPGLRQVMNETGLSRQEISKCCQDIIDNHGAEDYASAKHVEAALDHLMTGGAQFYNQTFPANEDYVAAKGQITGGTDPTSFEYALEHEYGLAISLGEMTEEEAYNQWRAEREARQAKQNQNGITVYRGYNRSENPLENNLTQMRSVYDAVGHSEKNSATENVPLTYYTESEEDAGNYANMDRNWYNHLLENAKAEYARFVMNGGVAPEGKEAWIKNRALSAYKTLTGRDNIPNGFVEQHTINPQKTLDLTSLGEKATPEEIYRVISRQTGISESDLDRAMVLSNISEEGDPFDVFRILRNSPGVNTGTEVVNIMRRLGFDSVRYSESGTNHYAMLNSEPTAENTLTEQPANTVTPESSVGAAQQGYDPYSAWQNQSSEFHPDSANGVRQADLPKENLQGRRTMQTGRTVMEAKATPENRVREIEQYFVDGHLSFVRVSNDQLAADAEESIRRNGWEESLRNWTAAVRSGQSSDRLVAMGAVLLNNIGNSNASATEYLNVLNDYGNLTSGTSHALQAAKIMQNLTPQGKMYMASRTAQQMNDQLNNTRRGRRNNRRNREDAQREVQEITRQRDDALNLIREIGEAFRGEQDGEPLTWQQQLSQELEQHVLDSQNANQPTRTPSGTIMIRDLYRFADDLIQRPERTNRPRRTAMDRIADYFANRAEYDQAWEQAQQAAMEQYADDPAAMERMRPFLNSGVNTNNGNASRTALSAVAEAVAAEEISRRSAAMRYQYGDMASLTNQIVNRITQTVPIENDADVYEIYNAVSEYLQDNLTRRNANGDFVNGDRMMPEMRRSLREFGLRMSDIIREGAETKGQVANLIAQDMIQRFGVSEDGAQEFANHVVNAFTMEVASRSESALESMFRERSRSQPRSFGEKLAELSNMGAFTNPDFANLATQKLTGDSSITVSLNPELVQDYLDAETDAERDDIMTEIQKDLARQLPTSWMEKWNALRYLNMLGNLKTQGRNIVGNTTMMLTAKAKRETLAAMEHLASAVTGGKYERMTSFVVSPELYAAARRDFRNVQKAALGEAKYGDAGGVSKNQFMRDTNEYKRIFNSRVLEAYRKATKWSMEQGDVIFSRATYANAFAGYLKAHGITAEEFANNPNSEVIDRGRMYAIKEAQEATFRDNNQFSDWVSKIGRRPDTPWFGRLAAEGIAPFRKTPANVLVRAEEYSPLGVVNSLVKTFQAKNVDSEVTAQDAMNSWAKTLTGSAICAAGFLMAKAGMLHGSNDDDDRQSSFDSLTGHQEYSIEIGGKSYTIDTFSPTSMPMLVGAAFYDLMEEDGLNIKGIENAITSLADPMINMSMLSGVNDAISNVQFADNNLIQLAINSGVGYLTQGLTNTMLGQLERTLEDNRMSTYTDENSNLPNFLQRQLGKASAKTPFWDYNQSEYIDNWGRTQDNGNWLERAFNNFINPVYTSEISTDPTDKMLSSLAEETGDTAVYPNSMYDIPDIKFDGEKGKLTQKQKESYQKVYGREYKTLVNDLRQSSEFQSLTSAEKTAALSKLEEYAVNAGKNAIGADTSETNWATASEGSVAQNAAYYAQYSSASAAAKEATGGTKEYDISTQLFSKGYDYDTNIKIMSQYLAESTVDRFKEAYADGYDFATANAFLKAYNENTYGYAPEDKKPRGYKKNGTIQWAQDNLNLDYNQAYKLWEYMKK